MLQRVITPEELAQVWAGQSALLPLDAEGMLVVIRVGNHIRLTPTHKMATIKEPGVPEAGEAPETA